MINLPKDIKNIILDYKEQLEITSKYNNVINQLNSIISLLCNNYSCNIEEVILYNAHLYYIFGLIYHNFIT